MNSQTVVRIFPEKSPLQCLRLLARAALLVIAPPVIAAPVDLSFYDINHPVDYDVHAFALSEDGTTVVGVQKYLHPIPTATIGSDAQVFRWTAADGLHLLNSFSSYLNTSSPDVSADGSVIVGWTYGVSGKYGFRWTSATGLVDISDGIPYHHPHAVSGDGKVIMGQLSRWTQPTGWIDIDVGTYNASFTDISADGSMLVGHRYLNGYFKDIFYWTPSTEVVFVNTPTENLYSPQVSADGRLIVGNYYPAPVTTPLLWINDGRFYDYAANHSVFRYAPETGVQFLPIRVGGFAFLERLSANGKVMAGSGCFPVPRCTSTAQGVASCVFDPRCGLALGTFKSGFISGLGILDTFGIAYDKPSPPYTTAKLLIPFGVSADGQTIAGSLTETNSSRIWFMKFQPNDPMAEQLVIRGIKGRTQVWYPAVLDLEDDILTCRLVTLPKNGTATIASDCASGTYTPNSGFFGNDNFTYVASDGLHDSNAANVDVTILETNSPPTARDINYQYSFYPAMSLTQYWTPIVFDTDAAPFPNLPFACRIVGQPIGASATVQSNCQSGELTVPGPGSYSFSYVVSDGLDEGPPGNVVINLFTPTPTNTSTPTATGRGTSTVTYTSQVSPTPTPTGGINSFPTSGNVNVSVVTGSGNVNWKPQVFDANGDPLNCRILTAPQNGTATVAANCSSGTYQSNPGFIGTDSFTYIANDGQLDSNPGTVTVSVTEGPVDQVCVQNNPVSQFTQTGKQGTLSITFTGNISSHANKEVKVCPGTPLSYQSSSTQGPVICKIKNNTTRGSGTLRISDHLKCTDKPAGKDKVHFKVKSGMN